MALDKTAILAAITATKNLDPQKRHDVGSSALMKIYTDVHDAGLRTKIVDAFMEILKVYLLQMNMDLADIMQPLR